MTRTSMRKLADTFAASDDFVADARAMTISWQLDHLHVCLAALGDPPTQVDLEEIVEAAFGRPAEEVVRDPLFLGEQSRLNDTVVAATISAKAQPLDLSRIVKYVRLCAIMASIARGDTALHQPGAIAISLNANITLPGSIFPPHTLVG